MVGCGSEVFSAFLSKFNTSIGRCGIRVKRKKYPWHKVDRNVKWLYSTGTALPSPLFEAALQSSFNDFLFLAFWQPVSLGREMTKGLRKLCNLCVELGVDT